MRYALIAFTMFAAAALAAPQAAAQTQGEAVAAAPSGDRGYRTDGAPRSALRNCAYVVDIRATALRFASGRRRHAQTVHCIIEDRAGANGAGRV